MIKSIFLAIMLMALTLPATGMAQGLPCTMPEGTGKAAAVESITLDDTTGTVTFTVKGYTQPFTARQPDPAEPERFALSLDAQNGLLTAVVSQTSATLWGPAQEGTAGKFDADETNFCVPLTQ